MSISKLIRYKKTIPFSQRLNDFINSKIAELINEGKVEGIDYTDSDEFDTFDSIKEYYNKTNRLMIWNGASENTIFADHNINLLFRAWHDYEHIANNFDFTTEGESMTAFVQMAQLPDDWGFERQLIMVEVIGQVLYNNYHKGNFPIDQRSFAISYLLTGDITKEF